MLTFGLPRRNERVPAFFHEYQATSPPSSRVLSARRSRVEQAMAYTALAPSKQVRAVLVLLCAELCRGSVDRAVPVAGAIGSSTRLR
jgi:geranylgeranyl pyrophosphate synthase